MAKILSFRAKAKAADGAGSEQDFLHHEDHTLSFQVTETGSMGLGNLLEHRFQTPKTPVCNDWTNQELADLYRVKRLLDAAGVPNDLDRGITDEGDPWLVFCGPDGEVFIHLCRLDALYVLDSPNIQTPLRGSNFNELIEAFTNRALPRTGAESGTDSRVIRLERGGKVYLHPSALLAALIWTLFLAAEEIVLMMPDEEQATDGLADLNALTFGDTTPDSPVLPVLVTENAIEVGDVASRASTDNDPRQVAAHEAFLRDNGSSGLTMTQNSYGMGLSTIAIAFGFMAEQSLSDSKTTLEDDILAADGTEASGDDGDTRALAENKLQAAINEASEAETVELAQFASADGRLPEEDAAHTDLDASEALAGTRAFLDERLAADGTVVKTKIWVDTTPDTEGDLPRTLVTAEAEIPAEDTQAADAAVSTSENTLPLPAVMTLSTLRTVFQPSELQNFSFGNTVVQASFDLTNSSLGSALPFLEDDRTEDPLLVSTLIDVSPPGASGFRSFDSDARAFMDFLLGKSGNVEMISLDTELILIDSSAFDLGSSTYVLSWALDDGGVISMVGLRSEFQDFDLIA